MGLLDGVDLTTGVDEAERRSKPTCNPCREGDCARCPTVLAKNGVFESDFSCRCYHDAPESHESAFDIRQEELHEVMEDGWFLQSQPPEFFGRNDWDSEGRTAYTSVEHLF